MEINVSQISQNFALSKADIAPDSANSIRTNQTTEDKLASVQPETKDLSNTADIKKQVPLDVSAEQIENAVLKLNEFVQTNSRQLNFSVDEGSNKQVVKVTDSESGKIIRQIPSEELLRLSERLQNLQTDVGTAVGFLFNKQV
ncbi:flagellar protein FlaG [Paraglaciecola sp. MB-3u-78]|uniref:flagellar protein FlaG n=1 Tax=Paraglaciecola sp. MB-3u-78 TaxID=2058332 RepID=UPI000C347FD0|nr:flagellar protein FlaG [Paraglaciecola sp. MB-3u-78]PKH00851.1 flagellar biosynthesis protein FlaG [Paraglaciecola sp. MB-3u-78]